LPKIKHFPPQNIWSPQTFGLVTLVLSRAGKFGSGQSHQQVLLLQCLPRLQACYVKIPSDRCHFLGYSPQIFNDKTIISSLTCVFLAHDYVELVSTWSWTFAKKMDKFRNSCVQGKKYSINDCPCLWLEES